MVQKDDIVMTGSNNINFRRDSRGRSMKPSEKKHETFKAYAVTPTTKIEATTPRQHTGNNPRCNQ